MRRAAFFSVLLFLLSACAEANPIEWGRAAGRHISNIFSDNTPPEAEPPAAEGRPFPNLATVPRRPRDPPEAKAQRAADLERLTRDRDAALADDQALRETGALPVRATDAGSAATSAASAPSVAPSPPAVSPTAPSNVAAASPRLAPATAPAPAPAPVTVTVQRVGSVSFSRNASSLTATAQRSLAEAAALARTGNGRVHLVPAQTSREGLGVDQAHARLAAITQALAVSGIPAARVTVDDALGQRIDLYDVYVER